ncbi:ATP-dependent DNA helicase chl1 [Teratosphaeriaceae sp. CCFEE 6253]|nr:ATP-dependent DNA helicase chl1 [Teratosphaeriaceae sp. CCFEE 6253]
MAAREFHHPFQPYDIQRQLMEAIYDCIEGGQVGIFESPTGTGKSLSLICSSFTWLREHKRNTFDEALALVQVDDDEPDWVAEHARVSKRHELQRCRADFEARLSAVLAKERKIKERRAGDAPPGKKRKLGPADAEAATDEEQFVLDDYESDDDKRSNASGQRPDYSTETTKLMETLGMLQRDKKGDDGLEDVNELKIYFCSRTHSQLSQFVGELQRVSIPSSMPPDPEGPDGAPSEPLRQLSLGSRKQLCIYPKVAKLHSQTAVNERCMELQQSKTASESKCPFIPAKESAGQVLEFRDHALARVRDIEDLAEVGSRLGICPYYASRSAIGPAEMVTLPYPLLLQKTARDALGISLKGHVVIIDEAHNLMDAIEGIYSVQISEGRLKRVRESLITYLQRYRNRLRGSNRVYVTQVVRVVDSMLLFFSGLQDGNGNGGTVEVRQLLCGKGVDQINLAKLVRYMNDSKLAKKVEGYVSHVAQAGEASNGTTGGASNETDVPGLTHVQNFLMALMNPSKEGRFFLTRVGDDHAIRYMLLDPSEHFRDIVSDARAVILVGGTMSPMDDYRQQLFPYLPNLSTFSCGHLIPPSNLLVRTVASDQSGPLEFSFRSRNNATTLRIGQALLALAPVVQGGLVVFLPSYGFLDQVATCWRNDSITARLDTLKPVFWDSRSEPAEATFKTYSHAIATSGKGAILLSVIGGKLSEGINFADDLGRCVVVVGLPFPNLETPEWKAKMQYIEDKAAARGELKGKASREHAENVCMRAVNQAIGRVIRHKDDWASIVLMDSRYTQKRISQKLPGWIKESYSAASATHVEGVVEDSRQFFARKRTT